MEKSKIVTEATKEIVVAAISQKMIALNSVPDFIEKVSEKINETYDKCEQPPSIG